jgi:hypothetical protein
MILYNILKPKSKKEIINQLSNLSQEEKLFYASENNHLNIIKLLIKDDQM